MKCYLACAMAVLGMNLWTAKLAMVITHAGACVTTMETICILILLACPVPKSEEHTLHGHSQEWHMTHLLGLVQPYLSTVRLTHDATYWSSCSDRLQAQIMAIWDSLYDANVPRNWLKDEFCSV